MTSSDRHWRSSLEPRKSRSRISLASSATVRVNARYRCGLRGRCILSDGWTARSVMAPLRRFPSCGILRGLTVDRRSASRLRDREERAISRVSPRVNARARRLRCEILVRAASRGRASTHEVEASRTTRHPPDDRNYSSVLVACACVPSNSRRTPISHSLC